MGRPRKGWRIVDQPGTDVKAVVWTEGPPGRGVTRKRSTGERDAARAAENGARIYAEALRGRLAPAQRTPRIAGDDLCTKGGEWLASRKDLDPDTRRTYALYVDTHLAPFFGTLGQVSPESVRQYSAQRLRQVQAPTVRHELSTLRKLVQWAEGLTDHEALARVPGVAKDARGTSYEQSSGLRRRGRPTELTEQETLAIIAALPEWSRLPRPAKRAAAGATSSSRSSEQATDSRSRFPIRARFIVKYETGLREALLDQLSVPEHWDPANPSELRITAQLDKIRFARVVALTPAAQAALASITTGRSGLVFGPHDYRASIRSAASRAGLPPHRVRTLAPNDLRHARASHLGAHPAATMAGMMHQFGWKQPQTAARYMHPTQEAQRKMLAATAATAAGALRPIPATVSAAGSKRVPPLIHSTALARGAGDDPQEPPEHGFG